MTIPLVALSTDRSKMRRLRLLIVTGAIAFLSSILILDPQVDAQTSPTATDDREDLPDATAVVAPSVKDKIDLSTISKAIVNEASRLKNDAAGWDQKLQELKLDLDLKKNRQDFEGYGQGRRRVPRCAANGCRSSGAGCGRRTAGTASLVYASRAAGSEISR